MKIAVVGAGISGLASAWLLKQHHQVTLFESGDYLGGHTHTVDVDLAGTRFPVDTGFLVFNHRTYPNLTALFRELKVDTVASDMSFAVSMVEPDLEWAGSSLATLFAQKRNLARTGFWRMLQDTLRFNRETAGALPELTLGDYLARHGYGAEFRDWYLLPMAAAIWSCPTQAMLGYPLTTFVRFARNHGLLQIFDRPQWQTVRGGGRKYVERIVATNSDDVRLASAGEIHAARCRRRLAGPARRRMRTLRRSRAGLPQRPGAGPARQRGQYRGRAAHPRRHPLPAQPRRAAYRCPPCCRATNASGRRGTTWPVNQAEAHNAAANSRSASPT
jgi:predicted NAD/FAD-binding protein